MDNNWREGMDFLQTTALVTVDCSLAGSAVGGACAGPAGATKGAIVGASIALTGAAIILALEIKRRREDDDPIYGALPVG